MSDDWMKEFDDLTFKAPHGEEYIQHSNNARRLKDINLKFNVSYASDKKRSVTIVKFSDNVKVYYPI